MIPRLLRELNLETRIKNKVHEVLDKNGYFRESHQVTITKFRNCVNINKLPEAFFDREYEAVDSIAQIRRAWNETLKQKLLQAVRLSRKPHFR